MRASAFTASRPAICTVLSAVACLFLSFVGWQQAIAAPKLPHLHGKNTNMTESNPVVVMDTTKGEIKIEIYANDAPKTAANFLDLVNKGFYNGLSFHRYEPGFCVQGGDPKGNGTGGYVPAGSSQERRIPLEVNKANPKLRHSEAGVIAMARSNDPNSASSQFYFTLGPANFLDGNYAVFGKVTSGLENMMNLRVGDKMTKVTELKPAAK